MLFFFKAHLLLLLWFRLYCQANWLAYVFRFFVSFLPAKHCPTNWVFLSFFLCSFPLGEVECHIVGRLSTRGEAPSALCMKIQVPGHNADNTLLAVGIVALHLIESTGELLSVSCLPPWFNQPTYPLIKYHFYSVPVIFVCLLILTCVPQLSPFLFDYA